MNLIEKTELKIDTTKRELRALAELLKRDMERLIERIDNNNLEGINKLGEIQGLGNSVDGKCFQLSALIDVKYDIESYELFKNKGEK